MDIVSFPRSVYKHFLFFPVFRLNVRLKPTHFCQAYKACLNTETRFGARKFKKKLLISLFFLIHDFSSSLSPPFFKLKYYRNITCFPCFVRELLT
jgi:hypothetical protein